MPEELSPSATDGNQTKNRKNENDEWQKILIALLFLLFSFSCVFCASQTALLVINRDRIDASMESLLSADYGFDPLIALAPLSEEIAAEAARDEEILAEDHTILSQGMPIAILPIPVPTPILVPLPTPPSPPAENPAPTSIAAIPTPTSPPPTSPPPTSPPPTSPPPTSPPPTSPPPTSPPPTSPPPTSPPPTSPPPTSPPPTSPPPTSPPPTDTPVPITISISDASVMEGNIGLASAVFTVTLSSASSDVVSVDYRTLDNTATASIDYNAIPTTTLIFPSGTLTRLITVTIQGDTLYENDETFFVNLSNANKATISDNQGRGTIIDDELLPSLSIDDVAVTEGDSSPTEAIFSVTLSAASSQTISVEYATANGSAVAPDDYTSISTTPLIFPPGIVTRLITITVQGDTLYETDESFFIDLANPSNANIGDNQGQGTIVNDDPLPTVDFESNAYFVDESNGPAVITVTLNTVSALTVTVDYATNPASSTAIIGSDYIPTSGTLTFTPGIVEQIFNVEIIDDMGEEGPPDETVELVLSNAISATLGLSNNPSTLAIRDDDAGAGQCRNSTPSNVINIGPPDCMWTFLAGGQVITDVTITGGPPIDVDLVDPDYDLIYYERWSDSALSEIALDRVSVEVSSDGSTWYEVFNWGDGILDTNTNIGQAPPPGPYGGGGPPAPGNEDDDVAIPMTTPPLYQSLAGGPVTGVAIDVDAPLSAIPAPAGSYRYVRITGSGQAEVDSIEVIP